MERATLHNEQEVRRLQLKVGGYVKIKRSGDVIPKVLGVSPGPQATPSEKPVSEGERELFEETAAFTDGGEYTLPSSCPSCGSSTIREEEGVLVRCTASYTCPAQVVEKLA